MESKDFPYLDDVSESVLRVHFLPTEEREGNLISTEGRSTI